MYLAFRDEADLPRIGIALTRAYLPTRRCATSCGWGGAEVERGLYTFADVALHPGGVGPAQRLREVVEEGAGRPGGPVGVRGRRAPPRRLRRLLPATVLAAAAARTERSG